MQRLVDALVTAAATLTVVAPRAPAPVSIMGRRQYKRLHVALPITVSGVDAGGNAFTQSAVTVEISARGMRVRGVRCFRAPGDPVEVRYQGRHARYRLAWIGPPSTCPDGLAGLEAMPEAGDLARLLFEDHFTPGMLSGPDSNLDSYVLPGTAAADSAFAKARPAQQPEHRQERRRHVRFPCAGVAQVWEGANQYAVTGRLNEISMGGCYVEMMSPMRARTAVRLELEIDGHSVRVEALVRTSQPAFGMGLEFTRVAPPELEKLHRVVSVLSGQALPDESALPCAADLFDGASERQVAEAVLRWFGAHDVLTRQDFSRIVEYLQRAAAERAHA
jgi:PilZ domain